MKKIFQFTTLLVLGASLTAPLFASAANSGGCSSVGPACTISTANDGTCAQNQETGDFYCQSTGIQSSIPPASSGSVNTAPPARSSSSGGGINLGVITPYSEGIKNLINGILVPVLMAIAFIVFLWGVFKYFILGAADEAKRAEGRQFVLWGIIGFVVILCVWGLVALVTGTLNLTPGGRAPNTPIL